MKLKGTQTPTLVPERIRPESRVELSYRELDITTPDHRDYLNGTVAMGQANAAKSWENYEDIGEVRYAITRSARIAGYVEHYAERRDAKDNITQTNRDSPTVQGIVNGITSRFGGVRGLTERYYTLMKVPGEALMIRFVDQEPDGYWFMSPDEVQREGLNISDPKTLLEPLTWKTARVSRNTDGSADAFTRKVQPEDVLGRVWNSSKRFVDEAESPMQAINPLCEMLRDLTESIRSRIRSRFAMAGMLLIPSEINDAAIAGDNPANRLYSDDKVLNYLIHVMSTNMMRTGKALDRLPIAIKGPADVLDKVRHMIFDAKVDEVDLKLRIELLERILSGLDTNKGASKDNEESSHWGAWANAQEEHRIAVEPDLQQLDHILTRMVLWRELKKLGWEDARVRPWRICHELNEAAVRVNQAEDFRQGWDRGWLSDEAGRRVTGAKETDMPSPEERVRQFGWKNADPYLAFYGLSGITIDETKVGLLKRPTGPDPDSPGDDAPVGPGTDDPGSPGSADRDTPKGQTPG